MTSMMDRRCFLLNTLAGALAAPLAAETQQAGKVWRIGWLSLGSRSEAIDTLTPFREALRQLGYQEGQTIIIEERWAEGSSDRLPSLAAELVGLKVDILVTESTPAARAAKPTTNSIPIVMLGPGDPVAVGLVSSLARPGGNVTGVSANYREISVKCVEVLRQLVPGMSRLAFLGNATNP